MKLSAFGVAGWLLLISGAAVRAQGSFEPVAIPVPIWNAATNPGSGVFLDTSTSQAVVVQTSPNGSRQVDRFDLTNRSRPTITVSLSAPSQHPFTYQYACTNRPGRQPVGSLLMELPGSDESLKTGPGNWSFTSQATSIPDRVSSITMATMRLARWSLAPAVAALAAPSSLTIQSSYGPGFVPVTAEGAAANPITDSAVAALPQDLAQQLHKFKEPPYSGLRQWVLAPLFRPGAAVGAIAGNYHLAVQVLARSGKLDPNSPFVGALMQALERAMSGDSAGGVVMPAAEPAGAVEQQLSSGLQMALSQAGSGN